jgi:hypothetical protein
MAEKDYPAKQTSASVLKETEVMYEKQPKTDLLDKEKLYSHDEVFKEFAERLNGRIGTNIPL